MRILRLGNNGVPTANLQVVELVGANSTNDLKTSDIFGGATPAPGAVVALPTLLLFCVGR